MHKPALLILRQIPYAETREEAQRLKKVFQHWCQQRGLTLAAELIEQDWDRMVTFYNYPKKQWQHLRTTNNTLPGYFTSITSTSRPVAASTACRIRR